MAAPGDLVGWDTVRALLCLEDDAEERVSFLVSAASAQAERIAGRILAARGVELNLDTSGNSVLVLPCWPVNSAARLCVDTERRFPPEKDLPSEDYILRNESGIIRLRCGAFPRAPFSVLFAGNAGYDPVPADLAQAVIEVVSHNLRRFSTPGGQVGIKSVSANGAVTSSYEIDIPVSSRNVFLRYQGARV